METKKLAGGILSVSVKACITVLTIVLLYLAGKKAFDFGTAVFDEKSMDAKGSGYDVMVTIPSGATNNDVADILLKDTNFGTLDGFDDILYGFEGEIIWKDSDKSREDLGFDSTKEFYENKIRIGIFN